MPQTKGLLSIELRLAHFELWRQNSVLISTEFWRHNSISSGSLSSMDNNPLVKTTDYFERFLHMDVHNMYVTKKKHVLHVLFFGPLNIS